MTRPDEYVSDPTARLDAPGWLCAPACLAMLLKRQRLLYTVEAVTTRFLEGQQGISCTVTEVTAVIAALGQGGREAALALGMPHTPRILDTLDVGLFTNEICQVAWEMGAHSSRVPRFRRERHARAWLRSGVPSLAFVEPARLYPQLGMAEQQWGHAVVIRGVIKTQDGRCISYYDPDEFVPGGFQQTQPENVFWAAWEARRFATVVVQR